jgi:predicted HTH transcriptional regulator
VFDFPEKLLDLIQFDPESLTVTARESKHREFKQAFVQNDFSDYTKTLAAFGNASGGYILFGVSDKPRRIVGAGEIVDEARWADRLRDDFDPEIAIATKVYSLGSLNVFGVAVEPLPHRPIVCKRSRSKQVPGKDGKARDIEVIREGAIYYRYSAQTRFIGYPELMHLMAERRNSAGKSFYGYTQRYPEGWRR